MSGQVTILQLPTAAALTGAESVPVVQNGVTVQTTTGAIAGAGALNYPFLTVGSTAGLTQARYITAGSGLSVNDNGAGSTLQINLTGAAQSLDGASNGLIVKTGASTVSNTAIAVGSGLTIANPDATTGNPTIGLNTTLQNVASLSGTGLVTINGSTFSQVTLSGTSGQISVANGNGTGTPTFSLVSTAVTAGTYTLPTLTVDAYGRLTSASSSSTTGTGGVVAFQQSPAFTGTPTAPTAALNTNTTQLATTAFVINQITGTTAGVQSFSAGTTGFTPSSATTGAVTLAGTLNVANGGTGANTLTGYLVGNGTSAVTAVSTIPNAGLTNSSITLGTTTISLGGTSLTPAGLTSVTVTQDPTAALQLATKQYVDSVAQGLNTKAAVLVATTANITLSGEQTIDGVTTSTSRVLVKNQSTASQNGIYVSASGAWARSADTNTWNQLVSAYVFVEEGTLQADTGWVCTVDPGGTLGVTAVTWAQFSGAGTYSAGTGLTLTGTQFSITNTAVTAGSYTNANITINAQGQITSASNGSAGGVTSFQTSLSGLTPSTTSTGAITLAGTLGISSGGTGQTTASAAFNALSPITTTGDLIIGTGTNTASRLAIGANGYVLTSNGTTASWQASTGGVTSFSAGTTGFTPSTGTTGAVTLAGTLNVANGGTGVTTLTGLAYGNGTSAFTAATAAQVVAVISTTAVTNATNATNVAATAGSGATNYIHFSSSATGNVAVNTNSALTYNYTNNALTAGINGGTF
jgi:hypothetical protein